MPRLYDIATGRSYYPRHGEYLRSVCVQDNLPVFEVSDVFRFLYESLPEWDGLKLHLAPPFPKFWMEYTTEDASFGAMFQLWPREDWPAEFPLLTCGASDSWTSDEALFRGTRWVLTADTFLSPCGKYEGFAPHAKAVWVVDFDGMIRYANVYDQNPDSNGKWEALSEPEKASDFLVLTYPMLSSIGYMGDTTNLEEVAPTRQQRRYAERKHAPIPYTYHVLKVKVFEEFRKRYSLHGGGSHSAPRLHEVRANWAYYAPDRPLFGKVVGMVFRSSHLRGNPDLGVVEKEYEVAPALQSA